MKSAKEYRRMAAVIWTVICMVGFMLTVLIGAGWGFFPAIALLFMSAFTAGMMASTFSLIERARRIETLEKLDVDVRTNAHHPTASQFCSCGWTPDPVPLMPDGSGDQDAIERMAKIHRLHATLMP